MIVDAKIVAYVQRLRDARIAEQNGDLEPLGAIFEEGKDIAWAACKVGLITFGMEVTGRGLEMLDGAKNQPPGGVGVIPHRRPDPLRR